MGSAKCILRSDGPPSPIRGLEILGNVATHLAASPVVGVRIHHLHLEVWQIIFQTVRIVQVPSMTTINLIVSIVLLTGAEIIRIQVMVPVCATVRHAFTIIPIPHYLLDKPFALSYLLYSEPNAGLYPQLLQPVSRFLPIAHQIREFVLWNPLVFLPISGTKNYLVQEKVLQLRKWDAVLCYDM